jgi:hypothetical protein
MINNDYAFTPTIDLDLLQIKKIVLENLNVKIPGMASHHRLVNSDNYLRLLRDRYPFLGNLYNIYSTSQSYITPIHVDAARNCALNIPIVNTENSHTVFYKTNNNITSKEISERVYHLINSEVTEVFRFTLTCPTLINTKVPHGVLDSGSKTRIIMSWSVSDQYNYSEVKKFLGS